MSQLQSQLQSLRIFAQVGSEPVKRPITRPSILFTSKEAADIDLDTIFTIALSGLDDLVAVDERFAWYKGNLFSLKNRELDREFTNAELNKLLDYWITTYLRLLSAHLQLPAALKTLEYLIRRFKIYAYEFEELLLCALPYHDTHTFVLIVQLINLGNSKWKFFDAVKTSGAPPPRNVIVKQCIRDMGVLEALCTYAKPDKKYQPSKQVISFCTAVIVDVIASLSTVESDTLQRFYPFVCSGLRPGFKGGQDHTAGSLMIIGLLASKVTLSPKVLSFLLRAVAGLAHKNSKILADKHWCKLSLMALVNLVQLQSVSVLPKRVSEIIIGIRDFTGFIRDLLADFNIDRFLNSFLQSLVDCSSDVSCHLALTSLVREVPMKNCVDLLVSKILSSCLKYSDRAKDLSSSSDSGIQAKQILTEIHTKYPHELRAAVRKFMEATELQRKKEPQDNNRATILQLMSKLLDGNADSSASVPQFKIWLSMDHPKAEVRRAAISGLSKSAIIEAKRSDSQRFAMIQDAILQQLHDDDLTVVQAVLSLDGLTEIIRPSDLFEALHGVLCKSVSLLTGVSKSTALSGDIALSCLKLVTSNFQYHADVSDRLASMVFPLLLILPKTRMLNLKALELAKVINWPFYKRFSVDLSAERLESEHLSSINMDIISWLAESFSAHATENIPWIMESCSHFELSKTVFLLILLQTMTKRLELGASQFLIIFDVSMPILKKEWEVFESMKLFSDAQFKSEMGTKQLLDGLPDTNSKDLNGNILRSIFWRLTEAFIRTVTPCDLLDIDTEWSTKFQELFGFLASSKLKPLFREHLCQLIAKSKTYPQHLLSSFFTDEGASSSVQVESLHCFSYLCTLSGVKFRFQLLSDFPYLLAPLSSDDQDIRLAAMGCIDGLLPLLEGVDLSVTNAVWKSFLEELLCLIFQQRSLILADKTFLPSLLTSIMGDSCHNNFVSHDFEPRFNQETKRDMLSFILGRALRLSAHGKLKILKLLKGMENVFLSVEGFDSLLSDLLERRTESHLKSNRLFKQLSKDEVDILCQLLEGCAVPTSDCGHLHANLLKALQISVIATEDSAILQPTLTVLQQLSTPLHDSLSTEMQEGLFLSLIVLFRNANGSIQSTAREAILRLKITYSSVALILTCIIELKRYLSDKSHVKKSRTEKNNQIVDFVLSSLGTCDEALTFISSVFDILLLKKDIERRESLLGPLFLFLGEIFSREWAVEVFGKSTSSSDPQGTSNTLAYIQQTLLLILEDICSSVTGPIKDSLLDDINTELLVDCAHSVTESVTRNHIFSLLSSITKICPQKVLQHVLRIVKAIGESTVTQVDRYSQQVFEGLMSNIVPCWLSETNDTDKLLQIFVDILPEISGHRRLPIVRYLLRITGESPSLASLLVLLFRSLRVKTSVESMDDIASVAVKEWEYQFAMQLYDQYSCTIWLPTLAAVLKKIGASRVDRNMVFEMVLAIKFCIDRLQDPEISFKLRNEKDAYDIQRTLGALLEQVVTLSLLFDSKKKKMSASAFLQKELKEDMRDVLNTIRKAMIPSVYFDTIRKLLAHSDGDVRKKALSVLCETMKGFDVVKLRRNRSAKTDSVSTWLLATESTSQSFDSLCLQIVQLIDDNVDASSAPLKFAAVSAVEVLATRFPLNQSVFGKLLASVAKNIDTDDMHVASCCLRATGALINVLGPGALPELPVIMNNALKRFKQCTPAGSLNFSESFMMAVFDMIAAGIDKLGGFLNPYLLDIIELMVLHPDCVSEERPKLNLKAVAVQKLFTEKIHVRIALPPLVKLYPDAVAAGEPSLIIIFEMLTDLICLADRPSINAIHVKIFDLCLLGLDLRRQQPESIQNVPKVENIVINTMTSLIKKLTEALFKPLFFKSVEWAELDEAQRASHEIRNLGKAISFYAMVDRLSKDLGSPLVPYFKYLLESCVHYLSGSENDGLKQKRKKVKVQDTDKTRTLSKEKWHLRALILSSLYNCFLHDSDSSKFLDKANFDALLEPIVSQLVVEPPRSLEAHSAVPSVEEVDNLLIICVGQMAVCAGTDTLWKELNNRVLMQTRSEKVRARVLGLRVVKNIIDNLKEEYLVMLAETIPFVGELLEDVESSVKTLAQEVAKELGALSNEDLTPYFK